MFQSKGKTKEIFKFIAYCSFQKQANSEVQKPTDGGVAFFAAVNHLSGPHRKQKITSTDSKGHGLWLADFDPFGVSVFQGSLLVIVIMIKGSEKRNCEGGFKLQSSCLF